jgi:hypothetical protein
MQTFVLLFVGLQMLFHFFGRLLCVLFAVAQLQQLCFPIAELLLCTFELVLQFLVDGALFEHFLFQLIEVPH